MEHKALIFGGGGAVLLIGFIVLKKSRHQTQSAPAPVANNSDFPFMSGLAPSSGGISTGGDGSLSAQGTAAADPNADTASIMSLFQALLPKPITGGTTQAANPLTGVNKIVGDLFQSELGRAPKQAGLDYYSARLLAGESSDAIKADIDKGPEYAKLHPAVDPTKTAIVNLFQTDLGRAPKDEGFYFYLDQVQNKGKSLSDVNQMIMSSSEYKNLHPSNGANSGTSPVGGGVTTPNPSTAAP